MSILHKYSNLEDLGDRGMIKLCAMMDVAQLLAQRLSTCKRARCGCVVVTTDFSRMLAVGYNGCAAGLPNDSCTSIQGSCMCYHAESNAIKKMLDDDLTAKWVGCILCCTTSPCLRCAREIVASKLIADVVFSTPYRESNGIAALKVSGIRIWHLSQGVLSQC